jgi:hypothetical protein
VEAHHELDSAVGAISIFPDGENRYFIVKEINHVQV